MLSQHFKTLHSRHIDRMGDISGLFWSSLVTAFCRDDITEAYRVNATSLLNKKNTRT